MRELRQSTAQTERIGPYLDVGDFVTEETALSSPPTEISKDGAAFGTGPTGTHDAEGWYAVTLTATHTDTLGSLLIKGQDSTTHLPVWHEFMVVTANYYDSKYGTDVREVDVTQWLGTAAATPTVAGVPEVDVTHFVGELAPSPSATGVPAVDVTRFVGGAAPATASTGVPKVDATHWLGNNILSPAVGGVPIVDTKLWSGTQVATPTVAGVPEVDVTHADGTSGAVTAIAAGIGPQKNQAFSNLEFLMVDETDGRTPETGLTVTGERSIDGGAFSAVSGSIAEVSDGIYQFDADAADMNGDIITFRFSSAGALDTFVTIKTTP